MELNETNICVDKVSVAISSEMFNNYKSFVDSLGNNNLDSGKRFLTNEEIGIFYIMYYNLHSRTVKIYRGIGSDPYNPLSKINYYGRIKVLSVKYHILEFKFKPNEYIVAKADAYYYQDYSGFFRMMNGIIGEVFKIQK